MIDQESTLIQESIHTDKQQRRKEQERHKPLASKQQGRRLAIFHSIVGSGTDATAGE
jgi:hypothetical protein